LVPKFGEIWKGGTNDRRMEYDVRGNKRFKQGLWKEKKYVGKTLRGGGKGGDSKVKKQ